MFDQHPTHMCAKGESPQGQNEHGRSIHLMSNNNRRFKLNEGARNAKKVAKPSDHHDATRKSGTRQNTSQQRIEASSRDDSTESINEFFGGLKMDRKPRGSSASSSITVSDGSVSNNLSDRATPTISVPTLIAPAREIVAPACFASETDTESFKQAIYSFWLNKARTQTNIDTCMANVPTWCRRYKVDPRSPWLMDYVYSVYASQPTMSHYGVVSMESASFGWEWWRKTLHSASLSIQGVFRYIHPIERTHHVTSTKNICYTWKGIGANAHNPIAFDDCTGFDECDIDHRTLCDGYKLELPWMWRKTCKPRPITRLISVSTHTPVIPRTCYHNELCAVVRRQLKKTPTPREGWCDKAFRGFSEWAAPEFGRIHKTFKLADWLKRYPAVRRENLQKVLRMMQTSVPIPKTTKAFVKRECLLKERGTFKPRCVSAKANEYLLGTAEFYAFQKMTMEALFGPGSDFVCSSGMTAEQVGEWFASALADDWDYIVENDFTTFDASQRQELNAAYNRYLKKFSPELQEINDLLNIPIVTGTTGSGIFYSRPGSFDSGRIDTTHGNTVKNMAVTKAVYEKLGYKVMGIFLGDDSVVFLKKIKPSVFDEQKTCAPAPVQLPLDRTLLEPLDVNKITTLYAAYGLECTPIVREDPHYVEYCSQRFWQLSPTEWVLGPKPGRWIAKTFVTHTHLDKTEDQLAHVRGVASCFKNCAFIPLLGHVLAWLENTLTPGVAKARMDWEIRAVEHHDITDYVVRQFEKIYNVTLTELNNMQFPPFEPGVVLDDPTLCRVVAQDVGFDFLNMNGISAEATQF